MTNFKLTYYPGKVPNYGDIRVTATFHEGKLSLSGRFGQAGGQIDMEFAHRNPAHNDGRYEHPITPEQIRFNPGWTAELWLDLLEIWNNWHLNDTQAACRHQQALGWDRDPIDPSRPTTDYAKFDGHQYSWNLKMWVYPPLGHLTEPCPVCGYKLGTAWLRIDVPEYVLDQLIALPY